MNTFIPLNVDSSYDSEGIVREANKSQKLLKDIVIYQYTCILKKYSLIVNITKYYVVARALLLCSVFIYRYKRDRDRDQEEEEEAYERRKLEKKIREKEMAYQEVS